MIDELLRPLLMVIIFLANLAGGVVVGVATVRAIVRYLSGAIRADAHTQDDIRLTLGRSLALALEFQLGADILATALNPSAQDVAILAAIVVLRTVLNFFLSRELRDSVEAKSRREPA